MSTIIGNPIMLGGGGGISAPIIGKDFNWTGGDGTYQVRDDGNKNWRIKFLTSGVFTPLKDMLVDAFLVGAGGGQATRGSGKGDWKSTNSAGGAGGYTNTVKSIVLTANTEYQIVIGEGGAPNYSSTNMRVYGGEGGTTTAFGELAHGGGGGDSYGYGGNGSSGGGSSSGAATVTTAGNGGSDGSDGTGVNPGTGQGTTTREFGEETGDLYAGGGGGYWGLGGDGGGGDSDHDGDPNTGGGGGGSRSSSIGYGGSGIVIIRKHKEAVA